MATTTFGKTTDGSGSSNSSTDKLAVSSATPTSNGTAETLTARISITGAGSTDVRGVIYADDGGEPGELLAVTGDETVNNNSEEAITFTFTGSNRIDIVSGVSYWIGLHWEDPGAESLTISRAATSDLRREVTDTFSDGSPDPFGTPSSLSGPMDVFVTFTIGPNITRDDKTPTGISAGVNIQPEKQFIFIVETDDGSEVDVTEKYDFASITRQINGSMEALVTTNKNIDTFGDVDTQLNSALIIRVGGPKLDAEGIDYFSGFIGQRTLDVQDGIERVTIRCFGHVSKLFQSLWRTSTTIVHDFTSGDTVTNIAKQIINNYRSMNGQARINFTSDSVEETTTTIKDKFEAVTYGVGLNRAIKLVQDTDRRWFWRVLADNVFTLKKATDGTDHVFIVQRDITSISLQEDLANAANEAFIYFNNATVRRYTDASNITKFGNRSKLRRETNVTDSTTADEVGNAVLQDLTPPILKLRIVVNDNFPNGIETINPGDTCQILNVPETISNLLNDSMLITKTVYKKDNVELELSIKHPVLESKLEKLRQDFGVSRTEAIPTTFTDA
ncbi:hypothetical protein LCGC14_0417990 [marine sediment metagenome]|uniref:Uncharacterized protein n=1 Tax=marine sediment metagenome TaxID=412755 RepID=A0A0F9W0Y3_9ZZZZ